MIADRFTLSFPSGTNLHTARLVEDLYDSTTGERVAVTGQPNGEIELGFANNLVVAPVGVAE